MKNKLRIIGLLSIVCLNFQLNAQSIFQLYSFYSSTDSKAKATCVSSTGSSYLAGEFSDELIIGFNYKNAFGRNSAYISKQTATGDIPFMQTISGTADVFVSVIQSHGDTLIIGGTYSDSLFIGTDTLYNPNFKGIYIGLYDTLGNYLNSWTTNSYSASLYDFKVSQSSQLVVGGEFFGEFDFGGNALNSTLGFNFFVFTLDLNSFTEVWIEKSDGVATNVRKIGFDDSGNIYAGGSYGDGTLIQGTSLPGVSGDHNAFVAKYNSIGNLIWVKTLTGPVQTHGLSLAVSGSGDVYFGGEYEMSLDVPMVGTLMNVGLMDAFIVKLNATGDFLWGKNVGTLDNDELVDVKLDNYDNPIILANAGKQLDYQGLDINSNGFYDPILIKLDKTNGMPIWDFRIPSAPNSGIVHGYSFDIRDSIISLCGSNKTGIQYFNDLLDSPNLDDSFWALIKDTTFSVSSAGLNSNKQNSVEIFPNPFSNYFKLTNLDADARIQLIDQSGSEIVSCIQSGNFFYFTQEIEPGVYILKITTNEYTIYKKLLH
jgi:hypothetical protein